MEDQLWQPDRETRAAISRGDKLHREYFKRKSLDYQLALIERLIAHQGLKGAT
ncbi:MAG: hypothetical protein IIA10_02305 [Proteobacteria bacterium]|nr:hypothetical protein [Pseudomonadota bacterium]